MVAVYINDWWNAKDLTAAAVNGASLSDIRKRALVCHNTMVRDSHSIWLRTPISFKEKLNGIYKTPSEYFVPLPTDDMVLARLEQVRDSIVRGTALLDREIQRLFYRAEELEGMLEESAVTISGMEKEFRWEWESRALEKLTEKLRQEDMAVLEKEPGPTDDAEIPVDSHRRKPIPRCPTRPSIKAIPDFSFVTPSTSSDMPISESIDDVGDQLKGLDIGQVSTDDFERAAAEIMGSI